MFDPFFCGAHSRSGPGLGLATAWRLARQKRGDLRFDPTARPVTRFILTVAWGMMSFPSSRRNT